MQLSVFLSLVGHVATITSVATAAISAFLWRAASRVPVPQIEDEVHSPSDYFDKIPMPEAMGQIGRTLSHLRELEGAVIESSKKNAGGAFWAMVTAALIAVSIAAGWGAKMTEAANQVATARTGTLEIQCIHRMSRSAPSVGRDTPCNLLADSRPGSRKSTPAGAVIFGNAVGSDKSAS